MASWDAKWPITKKLLQRIDLCALSNHEQPKSILDEVQSSLCAMGSTETIRRPASLLVLWELVAEIAPDAVVNRQMTFFDGS